MDNLETAIRMIISAAIGIEEGEENPQEAAQDIQKICHAALHHEPLPTIFYPWGIDANTLEDDPSEGCAHVWAYTGTEYGGDDESYHGEGRVYCELCGADGDA
jgi:hypothetical protein